MTDKNIRINMGCVGFFVAGLQLMFIGFKLTNVITWSWWWTLSPTWIVAALLICFFLLAVIVAALLDK